MNSQDSYTNICPICGESAKLYDVVPRYVKVEYGNKISIDVSRFRCKKCKKIWRILPDNVYPFKHYDKRIIFGMVTGKINQSMIEFEDFPSDATIQRWIREFKKFPGM